jgi:hypothetical protein
MAGTCSVCGQWMDDIESATVPQDKCWDHKNHDDSAPYQSGGDSQR